MHCTSCRSLRRKVSFPISNSSQIKHFWIAAENIISSRRRSRANSLTLENDRNVRSRSGSRDRDDENKSRNRKRSKSLVPCVLVSLGSAEVLYCPNEPKARSRVDLLRYEEGIYSDASRSKSNRSSPKRIRKPRASSLSRIE